MGLALLKAVNEKPYVSAYDGDKRPASCVFLTSVKDVSPGRQTGVHDAVIKGSARCSVALTQQHILRC